MVTPRVPGDPRPLKHRSRRPSRADFYRRRAVAATLALLLVAAGGYLVTAAARRGGRSATGPRRVSSTGRTAPTAVAPPPTTVSPLATVTISAVGDTMLGNTPTLPPNPSAYFAGVQSELRDHAQIVFGNLEGTLTSETASKCGGGRSGVCFAFRVPASYAHYLAAAGFSVLNNANNHSYDFGPVGRAQTVAALKSAGIAQTGLPGEVTVVHAGPVRVALVAFAPYHETANLLELPAAQSLIQQARRSADLVFVYMHVGAEGVAYQHVSGQEETYVGEDRGNAKAFAHMAVDAGASLVIASGPHVLRGMEFYRGHLVAYSLGNFAGYLNFAGGGVLSESVILHVTLSATGAFRSGQVVPITLVGRGQPERGGRAVNLIAQLSRADFGAAAAAIGPDGMFTRP